MIHQPSKNFEQFSPRTNLSDLTFSANFKSETANAGRQLHRINTLYRLRDPLELRNMSRRGEGDRVKDVPDKDQRSAVHALVHAFWKEHGFDGSSPKNYPESCKAERERYLAFFERLAPHSELKEAITWLSTPENYLAIRLSSRMRQNNPKLSEEGLRRAVLEIRAAATWVAYLRDPAKFEAN